MYCMKCGVRLAPGEETCPLCGLRAYHPDLPANEGDPLYPRRWVPPQPERSIFRFLITLLYLAGVAVCLLVDLNLCKRITWSGFALIGMGVAYLIFVMPLWFRHPNPIAFVPLDFLAVGLLLLYISLKTDGGWFLSFAFPVTGIYGILFTTALVLFRFIRRGRFLILGGCFIAFGCSSMLVEFFISITFGTKMFLWSLYPTAVMSLVGIFFLLAGLIPSLGEGVRKRIFM